MAQYRWEVPLLEFPRVAKLLRLAQEASRKQDQMKLAQATDLLRRCRGYPLAVQPSDTVFVVPKAPTPVIEVNKCEQRN